MTSSEASLIEGLVSRNILKVSSLKQLARRPSYLPVSAKLNHPS